MEQQIVRDEYVVQVKKGYAWRYKWQDVTSFNTMKHAHYRAKQERHENRFKNNFSVRIVHRVETVMDSAWEPVTAPESQAKGT